MFVFFVASSVGPLITPWEKRAGTYERLLSFPVTVNTLILGDVVAGMLVRHHHQRHHPRRWNGGVRLRGECHRSAHNCDKPRARRVLFLSARRAPRVAGEHEPPPNVMPLSNLVRFPLIFISGIFVPIASLQGIAKAAAVPVSPITFPSSTVLDLRFAQGAPRSRS